MAEKIEISPEFQEALNLMENTQNHVFITGRAGTGKSTLLQYFRFKTAKKVAVLAPTGVAALNVCGQTIHSFFGFKPDVTLDKVAKVSLSEAKLYQALDCLIIDEISMVRADLLDCIDLFLRLNGRDRKKPFGHLQMIFIGDLYQLPPVVTSKEKEIFSLGYESPYFFSSRVFNHPDFCFEFVELEKIYRQSDEDFIQLLNAIRNRTVSEEDLERLNQRVDPDFRPADDEFYITLTSTNDLAFAHNQEKLKALPGKMWIHQGFLSGEFEKFDRSSLPTDEILELKEGAQVMLVNNDRYGRWVNGTLGRVSSIQKKRHGHDLIVVELQDGEEVEVEPYTWELFHYKYNEKKKRIETEIVGKFKQYPLKLAWAVTIHKSQGKTFDRVIIDIGRGAFAPGQVYVALSRCTSLKGIILRRPIQKKHILLDYKIVRFLTRLQYQKAEEKLSEKEKKSLINQALFQKKEIEIVYLKPDDTKSRRRIRPISLELMEYKGKTFEGLRAFCFQRQAERTFRLDRILKIKLVS